MSIFMTLRIALKALNRNKMRTMLTMLSEPDIRITLTSVSVMATS